LPGPFEPLRDFEVIGLANAPAGERAAYQRPGADPDNLIAAC
jgi:hypothetical protein